MRSMRSASGWVVLLTVVAVLVGHQDARAEAGPPECGVINDFSDPSGQAHSTQLWGLTPIQTYPDQTRPHGTILDGLGYTHIVYFNQVAHENYCTWS